MVVRRSRVPTNALTALSLGLAGAALMLSVRQLARTARYVSLSGKTVLITGGSRGLGLVLARRLASRGARVAICGRDEAALGRAIEQLHPISADVMGVPADVTRSEDIDALVTAVAQRFGTIDVLINNVATIQVGPAQLMTEADYRDALEAIFWSAYRMTEAVLPQMRASGGGHIANIASVGGLIPAPHLAPYVTAKHALVGYSRAMRNELARDSIRVTTITPGLMRTGSARNVLLKGNARAEYAWFKIADSLPLTSMSAERAATQIIRAIEHGDAELTLTLSAKLGARVQSVFPNLSARFGALLNQFLPAAQGAPTTQVAGRDVETSLTRSVLGRLSDNAARRNNEFEA